MSLFVHDEYVRRTHSISVFKFLGPRFRIQSCKFGLKNLGFEFCAMCIGLDFGFRVRGHGIQGLYTISLFQLDINTNTNWYYDAVKL